MELVDLAKEPRRRTQVSQFQIPCPLHCTSCVENTDIHINVAPGSTIFSLLYCRVLDCWKHSGKKNWCYWCELTLLSGFGVTVIWPCRSTGFRISQGSGRVFFIVYIHIKISTFTVYATITTIYPRTFSGIFIIQEFSPLWRLVL